MSITSNQLTHCWMVYQIRLHLPRIDFHFQPQGFNFTVHRKQIPLALCYATTLNGYQGLTVQRLGLNLRRPVFSHGQLYSAMTCVPEAENVLILKYEGNLSTCTTNIVWNEFLLWFHKRLLSRFAASHPLPLVTVQIQTSWTSMSSWELSKGACNSRQNKFQASSVELSDRALRCSRDMLWSRIRTGTVWEPGERLTKEVRLLEADGQAAEMAEFEKASDGQA
jgi:hypothetical protein